MRRLLAAVAVVVLAACVAPPSQHDPQLYGTVKVALGPSLDGTWDWREDQRRAIEEGLALLEALGPGVALTTEGAADVVIRLPSRSSGGCGGFVPGTQFVEVDPACTAGFEAMKRAANHEVTHWWTYRQWHWAGHLCGPDESGPDCHPAVRAVDFQHRDTDALMRRGLQRREGDEGPTAEEAYVPPVAEPAPAQPDLDLVAYCQRMGRCL